MKTYKALHWPKLRFSNQRMTKRLQMVGDPSSVFQYFWFTSPHHFEYIEYLSVTLGCFIQPTSYPFDSHECNITMYDPNVEIEFQELLPVLFQNNGKIIDDQKPIEIKNHALQFYITVKGIQPSIISRNGHSFSATGLSFQFRRQNLGALVSGYFVPTGLYSFATILSFAIPKEQVCTYLFVLCVCVCVYNSCWACNQKNVDFLVFFAFT